LKEFAKKERSVISKEFEELQNLENYFCNEIDSLILILKQ
jgi:hypothetical protein